MDAHLALDTRGHRHVCPPLCSPLGTIYNGLLLESLNHASQVMLNMYEIEK